MAESIDRGREERMRRITDSLEGKYTITKETAGSKEIALVEGEELLSQTEEILRNLREIDNTFERISAEEFLSTVLEDEIGKAEVIAFLDYGDAYGETIANTISIMNLSDNADRIPYIYPDGSIHHNEHGVTMSRTNEDKIEMIGKSDGEEKDAQRIDNDDDHIDVDIARASAMDIMRAQALVNEAAERNMDKYPDKEERTPSVSSHIDSGSCFDKEYNDDAINGRTYETSLESGTFLHYWEMGSQLTIDHFPLGTDPQSIAEEDRILKETLSKYVGPEQDWSGKDASETRKITLHHIDKDVFRNIYVDLTERMPCITREEREKLSKGRTEEVKDILTKDSQSKSLREITEESTRIQEGYAVYRPGYYEYFGMEHAFEKLKTESVGSVLFMREDEMKDVLIRDLIDREPREIPILVRVDDEYNGKISLLRDINKENTPLVSTSGNVEIEKENVVRQTIWMSDHLYGLDEERKDGTIFEHGVYSSGSRYQLSSELFKAEGDSKTIDKKLDKAEELARFQYKIDKAWERNHTPNDGQSRTTSVSTCVVSGTELLPKEMKMDLFTHEIESLSDFEYAESAIENMRMSGTHLTYFPDREILVIDHRDIRTPDETRIMLDGIENVLDDYGLELKDVHKSSDSRYCVIENVTQEEYQDITATLIEKMPAITEEERDRVLEMRNREQEEREQREKEIEKQITEKYMERLEPRIRAMADSPDFYPNITGDRYEKISEIVREDAITSAVNEYVQGLVPTEEPLFYLYNVEEIEKSIPDGLDYCSALGEGVKINENEIKHVLEMPEHVICDIDYLIDEQRTGRLIDESRKSDIEKNATPFDSLQEFEKKKIAKNIAAIATKQTNIRENKSHIVILPDVYDWDEHSQIAKEEKERLAYVFSPAEENIKDGKNIEIKTIDELQRDGLSKDPNTIDVIIVDEKPSDFVKAMAITDPTFNPSEKFVDILERGDAGEAYLLQPEEQYIYYGAKEILRFQIELNQHEMFALDRNGEPRYPDPLSTIVAGEQSIDPDNARGALLRESIKALAEPGHNPVKQLVITEGREIAQNLHNTDRIIEARGIDPETTLVVQCAKKEFENKIENGYFDKYDKEVIICVEPYSNEIHTHVNDKSPNVIINPAPRKEYYNEEDYKSEKKYPISTITGKYPGPWSFDEIERVVNKQREKSHPEKMIPDVSGIGERIEKAISFEKGIRDAVSFSAYNIPNLYIAHDDPNRPSVCFYDTDNTKLSEEDKQHIFEKGITAICHEERLVSNCCEPRLAVEFVDKEHEERFLNLIDERSPIKISEYKDFDDDPNIPYYVVSNDKEFETVEKLATNIGIFAIENEMTIERALAEREHEQERTAEHEHVHNVPLSERIEIDAVMEKEEKDIDMQLEYVETKEVSPENVPEIEMPQNEQEHNVDAPEHEIDVKTEESPETTPDDCPPL